MSWKEFKESWQSWPKYDKIYFVVAVLIHSICIMAIILGIESAFRGFPLPANIGQWLLWLGCFGYLILLYVNTNKRIDKLKEKVKE